MSLLEEILASVARLPPEKQQAVLEFSEFLAQREARPGQPALPVAASQPPDESPDVDDGWPVGFFSQVIGSIPDFPDVDSEAESEVQLRRE